MEEQETVREEYTTPGVVELDAVSVVTLGTYAEDSADEGRYFQDWNTADRPGLTRLRAALTRCGTGWQAAVTTAYPTEPGTQ